MKFACRAVQTHCHYNFFLVWYSNLSKIFFVSFLSIIGALQIEKNKGYEELRIDGDSKMRHL